MNYILRVLIAIDQLLNVVVCNGMPDETMSSVAYRMERDKRFWGFMRPVIDFIFSPFEKDHCRTAYDAETMRWQQEPEFRPK